MKKIKEVLGKFFTIVAFIIFTIAWSIFIYVLWFSILEVVQMLYEKASNIVKYK